MTMGTGFADGILRDEAPDLVAFTVIVRGARSFALLVAILVLAFKVVFGPIEPRNARGSLPVALSTSARAPPKMRNAWNEVRHRVFRGIALIRSRRGRGTVETFMLC
jgi:hypothetical protein